MPIQYILTYKICQPIIKHCNQKTVGHTGLMMYHIEYGPPFVTHCNQKLMHAQIFTILVLSITDHL